VTDGKYLGSDGSSAAWVNVSSVVITLGGSGVSAGDVVELTSSFQVQKSTTAGSSRVVGVAVNASGGDVQVMISGIAKVNINGSPAIGALLESDGAGKAQTATALTVGTIIGKYLGSDGSNNHYVLVMPQ